jgi:pilus assembly protein Flp/PilA
MTPVTRIRALIDRFRRREDAQGLAEYALILALIAIVAIVALLFLGSQISDKLSIVGSTLQSVATPGPASFHGPSDHHPAGRSHVWHHPGRLAGAGSSTLQSSLRHARFPAVSSLWS